MKFQLSIQDFVKSRLRRSESGTTIIEVMVSATLSLFLVAIVMSAAITNRDTQQYDLARTRLNQNLRGALNLVATNIREAGENLPGTVPAVEIVDGGANPDELILRRNLLDSVLKLCQPVAAGSTDPMIFGMAGTVAGCIYGDQLGNLDAWRNHRVAEGGQVRAYLYDAATQTGEFFTYTGEVDSGSELSIQRDAAGWQNSYDVGVTAAYVIEEFRFRLFEEVAGDNYLQLIIGQDEANPLNVAFSLSEFTVSARMNDGSTQTTLAPGDEWTDIDYVEVRLSGSESYKEQSVSTTLTGQYYPRNILSN